MEALIRRANELSGRHKVVFDLPPLTATPLVLQLRDEEIALEKKARYTTAVYTYFLYTRSGACVAVLVVLLLLCVCFLCASLAFIPLMCMYVRVVQSWLRKTVDGGGMGKVVFVQGTGGKNGTGNNMQVDLIFCPCEIFWPRKQDVSSWGRPISPKPAFFPLERIA